MDKMEFELPDEVWSKDLEQGVMQYTDSLYEAVYDEDDETSGNTLSGYPFCGCDTCFWREALTYLVPRIIRGYKEGKILLDEDRGTEAEPEA